MARLRTLFWLVGLFVVVLTPAAGAEAIPKENALENAPENAPTPVLSPFLAQEIAQITGVQVSATESGLALKLESAGSLAESEISVVGNALIVEIANATLEAEEFQQFEPAEGIALVQVSQLSDRVRIVVTGTETAPTGEVSAQADGLALSVVPGVALAGETDEPLRIVVTGDRGDGYSPTDSSTATGTDTPLRDVPFSVQVIPRAVIEDRNVTEIGEALETAGGVVEAGGRGTSIFGPGLLIRGFPANEGIFRDGISAFSLSPLSATDLERVEVLRGPASVLFGQGEPGGIVNLVSKRPLDVPFYSASVTAGSFDTYRGALDFSGPLDDTGEINYRLNLSYENEGSFRDFVSSERLLISPIFTFNISPDTSLDLYGQYAYDRETIDEGLPALGDRVVEVPRDRFLNEEFGEFSQNQFSLGYRLAHDFDENLSVRHAMQFFQYEPRRFAPLIDFFDEETGDVDRLEYFAGGKYQRFFTNAEAIGRFNTGSIAHQVLFGAEYRRDIETPEFQFDNLYTPINVFNPVYTREPYEISPTFFRDDKINTVSLYLQDQIEITPALKLLAGIRYDSVNQFRTVRELDSPREEFEVTDEAFTPRFGVVYQPIEPVSLYASYTNSFNPAFGASRNADDSTFDPETGRQFEVGVKTDLSDSLSLNLAAFDIRRQNVETPDPNDPLFSLQTGEVASRGFELNLGGEILPGWNMTAAYTYLDAFVSEDTTDIVGNRLANVPDNQFSLWTTYELQEGDLAGLGAGLGLFYVSDRQGDLENTFTLPSYFRTDAALFYERDNWRTQLNIENLFNVEYFSSSNFGSRLGSNPGAPFGVSLSFSIDF
ncbi:MAG: TonB-dependent siderophore receptor [Phormidesmis sp.]